MKTIQEEINNACQLLCSAHVQLEDYAKQKLKKRKFEVDIKYNKAAFKITVQRIEPSWFSKIFKKKESED